MSLTVPRQWLYGRVVPAFLVVLPVFVDVVSGILGAEGRAGVFSIGVVLRGALVALALVLLLGLRARPVQIFLFAFFLVFLLSNVVWALASDVYSAAYELNQGMRVAFPWLLATLFLRLDRRATIDAYYLLSLLAWAGFLSALSLFAAMALGMGRETYGPWSYGIKGFFSAQNDFGLTLILTLVAAVVVLGRTRRIIHLVVAASIASAALLLGTRTGVLGPPAIAVALLLAALWNRRLLSPRDGRRGWWATAALVLPAIAVVGVGVAIFSNSTKTAYLEKRIYQLAEQTPRSELEAAGLERLERRGLLSTLLGDGGMAFRKHVAENRGRENRKIDPGVLTAPGESERLDYAVRRVENDLVDVLGFYGVLQFGVLYGGLAVVYAMALRRAIRAWNAENVAVLLMLTLFLGHSSLAGHALFSAQVGTVVAPLIFLQLRALEWSRPPARDLARARLATMGGARG